MYKVITSIIDITENKNIEIPALIFYEVKKFNSYNEGMDYLQGEANRLRNECDYTDLPFLTASNKDLGRNYYQGRFYTFANIKLV